MSSGSIYASLTIVNLKVLSDITVDSWHDDSTCIKFLWRGDGGARIRLQVSRREASHTYTFRLFLRMTYTLKLD